MAVPIAAEKLMQNQVQPQNRARNFGEPLRAAVGEVCSDCPLAGFCAKCRGEAAKPTEKVAEGNKKEPEDIQKVSKVENVAKEEKTVYNGANYFSQTVMPVYLHAVVISRGQASDFNLVAQAKSENLMDKKNSTQVKTKQTSEPYLLQDYASPKISAEIVGVALEKERFTAQTFGTEKDFMIQPKEKPSEVLKPEGSEKTGALANYGELVQVSTKIEPVFNYSHTGSSFSFEFTAASYGWLEGSSGRRVVDEKPIGVSLKEETLAYPKNRVNGEMKPPEVSSGFSVLSLKSPGHRQRSKEKVRTLGQKLKAVRTTNFVVKTPKVQPKHESTDYEKGKRFSIKLRRTRHNGTSKALIPKAEVKWIRKKDAKEDVKKPEPERKLKKVKRAKGIKLGNAAEELRKVGLKRAGFKSDKKFEVAGKGKQLKEIAKIENKLVKALASKLHKWNSADSKVKSSGATGTKEKRKELEKLVRLIRKIRQRRAIIMHLLGKKGGKRKATVNRLFELVLKIIGNDSQFK